MIDKGSRPIRVVASTVLLVLKQLSVCSYGDVQWVSESSEAPGQLASLANERLNDGVRDLRWQKESRAAIECANNVLRMLTQLYSIYNTAHINKLSGDQVFGQFASSYKDKITKRNKQNKLTATSPGKSTRSPLRLM